MGTKITAHRLVSTPCRPSGNRDRDTGRPLLAGLAEDGLIAPLMGSVVDVLDTATGARRQPLLFEITTAGYDRHSICFEHQDYSIKVLEGIVRDDAFAFIAGQVPSQRRPTTHIRLAGDPRERHQEVVSAVGRRSIRHEPAVLLFFRNIDV